MTGHTQAQDLLVKKCPPGLTPVLHVLDELVSSDKISGPTHDGTVSDVSGLVTVRLAASRVTAELS